MSSNPYYQIKKVSVSNFSKSSMPYSLYDVVQVPSGAASGQYLVSSTENNLTIGIPNIIDGATGNWYNFQDSNFDFANIWKPSYTSNINSEPKVIYHQFGDGYSQRSSDGMNHQRLVFDVIFQDCGDKEIKSLLAFFEYKGGTSYFYYTIPEPYNTRKKFTCKNWRHQFVSYNRHNLTAQFSEEFDN